MNPYPLDLTVGSDFLSLDPNQNVAEEQIQCGEQPDYSCGHTTIKDFKDKQSGVPH